MINRDDIARLSLAYHLTFDYLAMEICRLESTVTLYSNNSLYSNELRRRLLGYVQSFTVIEYDQLQNDDSLSNIIIWSDPMKHHVLEMIDHIQMITSPGLKIFVVGTTRFRCQLPEWKNNILLAEKDLVNSPREIRKGLQDAGFVEQSLLGFHGVRSIFWFWFSRIPARLGRFDIVDRCLVAMRKNQILNGWQTIFSSVWLLNLKYK